MTYIPARVAISSITQADPGVVTTSTNHNLTTGQVVRLHVPQNYGMFQLNQMQVIIKVLSATMFSIFQSIIPNNVVPISTTNYPAFTIPAKPSATAEVLPMGSGPTPLLNTTVQILKNTCDDLLEDAITNIDTVEIPF